MKTFNEVWVMVQPIVTSALFSAICTAIICGIIKGVINKRFSKYDVEEFSKKACELVIDRLQGMTFTHDIEPLVESKLAEIKQELTKTMIDDLSNVRDIEVAISKLIGDFTKYFDNANGIPEEVRKQIIADLKNIEDLAKEKEKIVVESTPIIEEKKTKKETKKHEEKNDVER